MKVLLQWMDVWPIKKKKKKRESHCLCEIFAVELLSKRSSHKFFARVYVLPFLSDLRLEYTFGAKQHLSQTHTHRHGRRSCPRRIHIYNIFNGCKCLSCFGRPFSDSSSHAPLLYVCVSYVYIVSRRRYPFARQMVKAQTKSPYSGAECVAQCNEWEWHTRAKICISQV